MLERIAPAIVKSIVYSALGLIIVLYSPVAFCCAMWIMLRLCISFNPWLNIHADVWYTDDVTHWILEKLGVSVTYSCAGAAPGRYIYEWKHNLTKGSKDQDDE